jgi:hypothetical protein
LQLLTRCVGCFFPRCGREGAGRRVRVGCFFPRCAAVQQGREGAGCSREQDFIFATGRQRQDSRSGAVETARARVCSPAQRVRGCPKPATRHDHICSVPSPLTFLLSHSRPRKRCTAAASLRPVAPRPALTHTHAHTHTITHTHTLHSRPHTTHAHTRLLPACDRSPILNLAQSDLILYGPTSR